MVMSSTLAIGPHYADPRMGLVEQWRRIRSELEADWGEATLNVAVPQAEQRAHAASLLGPAGPGRRGDDLRLAVHRAGGGIGPDQADKLFRKLDEARIRGTVTLVTVDERVEPRGSSARGARRARGTAPSPACLRTGATCSASCS